jgi:hypothetical protein
VMVNFGETVVDRETDGRGLVGDDSDMAHR